MKTIVVDIELNCPNTPEESIIQIGAVVCDMRSGKLGNTLSILINPGRPIDPFIVGLCGITDEMVKDAVTLPEALEAFWIWVKEQNCGGNLSAWGSDIWEIKRATDKAREAGVPFPIYKIRNMDIKAISQVFRVALPQHAKARGGLRNSLETFGLEFQGRQHNALDDAINTARLLGRFIEMQKKYQAISNILKENK